MYKLPYLSVFFSSFFQTFTISSCCATSKTLKRQMNEWMSLTQIHRVDIRCSPDAPRALDYIWVCRYFLSLVPEVIHTTSNLCWWWRIYQRIQELSQFIVICCYRRSLWNKIWLTRLTKHKELIVLSKTCVMMTFCIILIDLNTSWMTLKQRKFWHPLIV